MLLQKFVRHESLISLTPQFLISRKCGLSLQVVPTKTFHFAVDGNNTYNSRPLIIKESTQSGISVKTGLMITQNSPVFHDLVLIGGGHSHAIVLKNFGMQPMTGVRITVISRDIETPYSGMLPGYVAGHYTFDECHIDLRPLAQFAGACLIHASAIGINKDNKEVLVEGRPPIRYDVLSINIGITSQQNIPGASLYTVPVKPIDTFSQRWESIRKDAMDAAQRGVCLRVAVVGGGAGGVELALAVHHRLSADAAQKSVLQNNGSLKVSPPMAAVTVSLYTRSRLLPSHPPKAAAIFARIFKQKGIEVHSGRGVVEVTPNTLLLDGGAVAHFDHAILCTQGGAASWLPATGLSLDPQGFLLVDPTLQVSHSPGVFASGDIHASLAHPRAKAGVVAVRQGLPLANNLRAALEGKPLKEFVPQREWLSLISTGEKYAVATRGSWLALEGSFLWSLKDWIDCRFMKQFSDLPAMGASSSSATPRLSASYFPKWWGPHAANNKPQSLAAGSAAAAGGGESASSAVMRCGGCGSKIGSHILTRVLSRLQERYSSSNVSLPPGVKVLVGLDSPDDAAVVTLPPGMAGVHTVDFFRSLFSSQDLFTLGRIAANHALSDCYAMGATPLTAMAMVTMPHGLEAKVEEDLFQLLAGGSHSLTQAGCLLVGGHSSEGSEVMLGYAVHAMVDPTASTHTMLTKGGLLEGQALVLTKPIGTGVLLASCMHQGEGQAKGRWIDAAIDCMLLSNQKSAEILRESGATGCTDISGFGLLGHLVEMTKASKVGAVINLPSIPLLDGALECVSKGVFSSLYPSNVRLSRAIGNVDQVSLQKEYPLLFDPQTSGGLLAGIPVEITESCLQKLRVEGYSAACVIGHVRGASNPLASITVTTDS